MLKTFLIIGMYNHFPEGVSDSEFETVYQTCYRPFLSVLNRFADIQATLYFSGSLLRRLEARHPEYLMLLEEMTARRQIEILGGGFYDPVLPLIPTSDRLGQIELLTTYLRKSFGKRPRGCWLSEYAWEPWLASTLQTCGMDYTFLLDSQFKAANGGVDPLIPVVTEDQGRCLTVFPTYDCSESFGKVTGFDEAAQIIAKRESSPIRVLMAPGEEIRDLWENSGLESPDIYIERTLAWFRKNALEFETITPSRFLKSRKASVRAYFPGTASQRYMAECSLARDKKAPATHPSLRNVILRSNASSTLYSRMYYVHLTIGQLRGDRSRKKTAIEDLWRGQSGDAYWLSKSGGVRLPSIREAAYRSLLDAEQTTRIKGSFKPGILRADTDSDGQKEIVYQGVDLNAYVHLRGAALVEFDTLKARRNLCDLYSGENDSDHARKACFVDRVYQKAPDARSAVTPRRGDLAIFSNGHFEENLSLATLSGVTLYCEDIIEISGAKRMVALKKVYAFYKRTVQVSYSVINKSDAPLSFWLGVEFNLAILPEQLETLRLDDNPGPVEAVYSHEGASIGQARRIVFQSHEPLRSAVISSSRPGSACTAVVSAAISERRSIVQGFTLVLSWPVDLAADEEWNLDLNLSAGE
ncbi:MAG: DUF1926 domain-containing protein [Spirochaetales bacterium]|nr:MAG: DUF1926 domain-containing protein [Spirochaetales bacterium]